MDNHSVKKLYRSSHDRMIFGVCGGLGEYFGIDSMVFRALFLLLSFGGGAGILIYLIMAVLVPAGQNHSGAATDPREKINEFARDLRTGAQNLSQEFKTSGSSRNRGRLVGLIIVFFGCVFLLTRLFPDAWSGVRWDLIWPLALIIVGLVVIAKKN